MSWPAIIWSMITSACLTLAAIYFLVWCKNRRAWAPLFFSVTAVSTAGWAFCEGQLLAISDNETLFNLIGTTYGGDGQSTFALPDLRGRIPIHQGNGFILAETGGTEEITLTVQQIPAHEHYRRAGQ